MVCLGNICRSPLAEGILQEKVTIHGLDWFVDSAGTGGWHTGEQPDERSIAVARENGIDLTMQRARKFREADFEAFDHILVMDSQNYTDVVRLAKSEADRQKVELMLNYRWPGENRGVPDPYFGGKDGFTQVFEMLDEACEAFIRNLK